jgi:hypothetical protein
LCGWVWRLRCSAQRDADLHERPGSPLKYFVSFANAGSACFRVLPGSMISPKAVPTRAAYAGQRTDEKEAPKAKRLTQSPQMPTRPRCGEHNPTIRLRKATYQCKVPVLQVTTDAGARDGCGRNCRIEMAEVMAHAETAF